MHRHLVAALGLLTVAASGALTTAVSAAPSAAPGHDVHKVITTGFADPGLLKANGRYHLYATGAGFRHSSSDNPDGGFSRPKPSMTAVPDWFGERSDGGAHLWAPHVFRVPRQPDGTSYVMWFTASKAGAKDCLGWATAAKPGGPFDPTGKAPLLCGPGSATVIDPAMFRAPSGKRYLVFKVRHFSPESYELRRIRVTGNGRQVRTGATSRQLVDGGTRIVEAPSLVKHGGRVWMFTSRRVYYRCSYHTEVFSAPSITGRFRSHGTLVVRNRSGRDLCGDGGAEVVRDGKGWLIAFHAWRGFTPTSSVRQAWTGRLRWSSRTGVPYVARS